MRQLVSLERQALLGKREDWSTKKGGAMLRAPEVME